MDSNGINFKLVEFNDISSLVSAYLDHTLTGIVVNTSQLINLPPDQALLDLELSTKGMSMVLPENESSWADVVRWTIIAPIAAESLGISSNNLDSLVNSRDPEIRRFLGLEGNLGKSLGISNDFANQMIVQRVTMQNSGKIILEFYREIATTFMKTMACFILYHFLVASVNNRNSLTMMCAIFF